MLDFNVDLNGKPKKRSKEERRDIRFRIYFIIIFASLIVLAFLYLTTPKYSSKYKDGKEYCSYCGQEVNQNETESIE